MDFFIDKEIKMHSRQHQIQDTALRDIQDLIEKRILVKSIQGGRSTNYELKSNE